MPWTKPYLPVKNQRLDDDLYQHTGWITFITIRAYEDRVPFTDPALAKLVVDLLQSEQERLMCDVYTYCLMPDHLHYLIAPREDGKSVLDFTNQFKGKTTNQSWMLGWKGKLWQPRFYDHVVRSDEDLERISQYILSNPVRKALVASESDWPWSGQFIAFP